MLHCLCKSTENRRKAEEKDKTMAKRVTIEMVAREAGVSRGTVDRVINCRPHVRADQ